jgi:hypothetical protein
MGRVLAGSLSDTRPRLGCGSWTATNPGLGRAGATALAHSPRDGWSSEGRWAECDSSGVRLSPSTSYRSTAMLTGRPGCGRPGLRGRGSRSSSSSRPRLDWSGRYRASRSTGPSRSFCLQGIPTADVPGADFTRPPDKGPGDGPGRSRWRSGVGGQRSSGSPGSCALGSIGSSSSEAGRSPTTRTSPRFLGAIGRGPAGRSP